MTARLLVVGLLLLTGCTTQRAHRRDTQLVVTANTPQEKTAAARWTVAHARDDADAAYLLDVLGLQREAS